VAIVQTAQIASALPGCEGVAEMDCAWRCHSADIGVQLHSVKWICALQHCRAPSRLDTDVLNGCCRVTSTTVSTCRIEADPNPLIAGLKEGKPRFVGPPEAAFHKFVAFAPKRTDTELDFLKGAV
jgi:hypothetical protein